MMQVANDVDVPPIPDDWDGTPEEWARDWPRMLEMEAFVDAISDAGAARIQRRERRSSTLVYFIQADRGEIKIGHASNPHRRLGELQIGHPDRLTLLGSAPGGRDLEEKLHQEFGNSRLRAEWFQPTHALIARITELTGATKIKKMGWCG